MGFCLYAYNPSELYRRTRPGTAPETVCGARTFPAADEPEVIVVRAAMGPDGAVYEYRPTGRMVTRAQHDPYCPEHGGSPAPPPPPVTIAELEHAWAVYEQLTRRYDGQDELAQLASPAPEARAAGSQLPAGLAPELPRGRTVSVEDLDGARRSFEDLVARAEGEGAAR